MKSLFISALSMSCLLSPALAAGTAAPDVVINEVDADQVATDSVEFFELTGAGGTSLAGVFAVLYNGSTDVEYNTFDLSAESIPGDGFFVVGAATVANVDLTPGSFPATNAIQNGADGIALWFDPSGTLTVTDFDATTPTTGPAIAELVDAVVYDTNDPDDAGLLAGLFITGPQINEDEGGAKDTESFGRCPDGGTALDTNTYATGAPTPGAANDCPAGNAFSDQGCALAGVTGDPLLVGTGTLEVGSSNMVDLTNAATSATAALFLATASTAVPFKGGTLKPFPFDALIFLTTSGTGTISVPFTWPAGFPPATEIWVQYGIQDAAGVAGVSLSNAILGVTP